MKHIALCISAVCVAPLLAFAVLWTGILAALAVMALWYSGTLVPVSFLMAGLGYYLLKKPQPNTYHPKHIISAH
jgi:hypothetical protein